MNPRDAIDGILRQLYQAMLDEPHWPAVSALVDEACGISGNGLVVGDGSDDSAVYFCTFLFHGERRQDLERAYFEVYHDHDEALPRLRAAPDGQLVYVPDLYSEEELKTSPAYNEMLPRLSSQKGLDVHFDGPDGLRIVWSIGDPVATAGWQSAQLELLDHLLPHVRQFVLVRQALAAAGAQDAGLAALLDQDRIGAIHLDRRGRVVAANATALAILRRGDGLYDRDGALHAWLPEDRGRLRKLLRRALPSLGGEASAAGSMTVRRPPGRPRLTLHVTPVGGAAADYGGLRVAALVLLVDPASRPRIDPGHVATVLGLMPSEGRVTALLAEGRSVREIAALTAFEEGYVRWLLKQVYKKQGVSGQVALVRLALAASALPRR